MRPKIRRIFENSISILVYNIAIIFFNGPPAAYFFVHLSKWWKNWLISFFVRLFYNVSLSTNVM